MSLEVVSIFTGKQMELGDIEKGLDCNEEPWFKRAHVGKFLDIRHMDTSTTKINGRRYA